MEWKFGHEFVQPSGCKELHFPLQTSHRQLRNTEMHLTPIFWGKSVLCCPSSPRLGELPTSTAIIVPHSVALHVMQCIHIPT